MVACLVHDPAGTPAAAATPGAGVLEAIARASSPHVEPHGETAVLFDVDGLARVCGPPEVIAREVMAQAAVEAIPVRLALAGTRTAAWILAHATPGVTVVPSRQERAALADLALGWLASVCDLDRVETPVRSTGSAAGSGLTSADSPGRFRRGRGRGRAATRAADTAHRRHLEACRRCLVTFERWGLATAGAVAALPRGDVHARMGPVGVRLHQAACGEDAGPLVPCDPVSAFADRLELEWPIEGLEPLSFVLARQFERLSSALERADRGAVAITTRLVLVTREVHTRILQLPAPMRDARVLRTLVLLDLESHPPAAAIDVVEIALDVTPGRIVQGSLLARALPSPEDLATLLARLGALMGESRIGRPVVLDTFDDRAVGLEPFDVSPKDLQAPKDPGPRTQDLEIWRPVLRRFRLPIAARVAVEQGRPVRVVASARGLAGGAVVDRAGPWRTSGAWWALDGSGWDRDAWDLALADGGVYRVTRNRLTGAWDIEGAFD